jgi:hypothetical protein
MCVKGPPAAHHFDPKETLLPHAPHQQSSFGERSWASSVAAPQEMEILDAVAMQIDARMQPLALQTELFED